MKFSFVVRSMFPFLRGKATPAKGADAAGCCDCCGESCCCEKCCCRGEDCGGCGCCSAK